MVEQPSGTVTLVFTDIEGSTRLLQDLGRDAYVAALAEHRHIIRAAFARHDGYEVDSEGDAFFYAFASAPEAVAAVEEAIRELEAGPIRVRVGIHTGEPGLDPPKYVGLDVHLTARVMAVGHGGQVLVTRATRDLLNLELIDLGVHPLPDIDQPVWLYQIGARRFPPLRLKTAEPPAALTLAAAVPSREPRQRVRRTVTVVFADLTSSTGFGERLDPESLHRVLVRYSDTCAEVLERYGGVVESFVGDRVMAVFGLPTLHEDDALRAVRAAVALRQAVDALSADFEREAGAGIGVKLAINSGEVFLAGGRRAGAFPSGEAINVAKRFVAAAGSGEILLGQQTYRLVGDVVQVEAVAELAREGDGQPVRAWRLLDVLREVSPFGRGSAAPFVGRGEQLEELRSALDRAVGDSGCEFVTVLGPAGIGKSRLLREFVSAVDDQVSVVAGRCLSYGEGITYWPLVEIVKQLAGEEPERAIAELAAEDASGELVASLVSAVVGASERETLTDEINWAVRRLFETLARARPLVVVLEDLQWAEPTFLDLVEYLVGFSHGGPVLLLASARPELLEMRSGWVNLWPNARLIPLEPLPEDDVDALIDSLQESGVLPERLRKRTVEAAEGNPLFVEQLLAMAADDEVVDGDFVVPPTLHALIAARIDRLEPDERAMIERASVEGRDFHRGAVASLSPPTERAAVGARLLALVRKGLVQPARSDIAGDDGFRFAHSLVRDAAYVSMPKELRAELHERHADWLEGKVADRSRNYEEIVGYHLEWAWRYRRELGPVGERERKLAARAAERLWAAGRRASTRMDRPAAVNLLQRAEALLPDEETGALLQEFAAALNRNNEYDRVEPVLVRAIERASASNNVRTELHARLDHWWFRLPGSDFVSAGVVRDVERLIGELDRLGDDLGLTKAWQLLACADIAQCRFDAAKGRLEQALIHARRCGDRLEEAETRVEILDGLYKGPTPVASALSQCHEVLQETPGDLMIEAAALNASAGLQAMLGQFAEARELLARSGTIAEDQPNVNLYRLFVLWDVEMLADDPVAAERQLRVESDTLSQTWKWFHSWVAAALAHAFCAQGRYDEAEPLTEVSEAAAGDWIRNQVRWRGARAKALAHRGQGRRAQELASEAVLLAKRTDALNLHGDALLDLAEVVTIAEGPAEARPLVEQARRLFEQKGNLVMVGRCAASLRPAAAELPDIRAEGPS